MQIRNLYGQKFGNLTVTPIYYVQDGHAYWLCRCECGEVKFVRGSHMTSGNVSSCGCTKGNIKHRESKTRLYHIWNGMRERCFNENIPDYSRYGGRGIYVCPEWAVYENFRDWALANGYADNLSIDRIDNNSNYCPENCRWATAKQQANNTRKTRLITYNGETHSVSEWARILNIKQSTLSMRINKYGWSVEKAFGKEGNKYVP